MSDMGILQQFGATLLAVTFSQHHDCRHSIILQGILTWTRMGIVRHRGLGILAGGRAISEFGKIDRILAEMLGLLIAAATGALGYVLKNFSDDLGSDQDSLGQ